MCAAAGTWKSAEIRAYRRKGGDTNFYAANLGLAPGAIEAVIEVRETFVRKSAGDPEFFLGVAELRLSAAGDRALPATSEPGNFQRIKVLTNHIVLRQGHRALVVYTEQLRNPQVAAFIAQLSNANERGVSERGVNEPGTGGRAASSPWNADCD